MLTAWALTLLLDHGRVFSLPREGWTIATVPGVEASCGPLTLTGTVSYDKDGYFSRDLTLEYTREVSKRLDVSISAARIDYKGFASDLTWNVGLRWTLVRHK